MDAATLAAAHRLLALVRADESAQTDAPIYGNWIEHLSDYVTDEELSQPEPEH